MIVRFFTWFHCSSQTMLRLLLLALLLLGLGTGLQRGWLEVRWDRMGQDLETYVNREPQP